MRLDSYSALACLALLAGPLGCGVPEASYDTVVRQRDSLATTLDSVRAELDEVKFGAARLLATAKAALDAGRLEEARDVSGQLLTRHPEAPEAVTAKTVLASAERQIASRAARAEHAHRDSIRAAKTRLARALSSMRPSRDNVREITWYYDRTVPHVVNDRSQMLLYIGRPDDGQPYLRFSIRYVADSWLFIQRYVIKADDQTFTIEAGGLRDVERDNGYGGIWEWYDVPAESDELAIVRAVIASKHAVLRYGGQHYHYDRVIPRGEKAALQRVLDAYEALTPAH